jgi:hypothetical protein
MTINNHCGSSLQTSWSATNWTLSLSTLPGIFSGTNTVGPEEDK